MMVLSAVEILRERLRKMNGKNTKIVAKAEVVDQVKTLMCMGVISSGILGGLYVGVAGILTMFV